MRKLIRLLIVAFTLFLLILHGTGENWSDGKPTGLKWLLLVTGLNLFPLTVNFILSYTLSSRKALIPS